MKEDDGWTKDTWAIDKKMTMGSGSYGREWSIRVPKGGERLITRHTSLGNVPMLTHTFYAGWTQGVNNNNQKIQS